MAPPLVEISQRLAAAVSRLKFAAPVSHVYNPLAYAWAPHAAYLRRYGNGPKQTLFLGMNPGPFGMAQTGVPFGDVPMVRGWLALGHGSEGEVKRPKREHDKRPIEGFACTRREVSGTRFWGWAAARWKTPERFFASCFVWNYCPLVFMDEGGRNITPDKLPPAERAAIARVCDGALLDIVDALQPRWVIGVGAFADKRAREALAKREVSFGCILHPSPASPAANRDWQGQVEAQLAALGVAPFA